VLVNNAGRTQVGAVEETTDDELRSLFDLHVFGPFALTRAVPPHMRERGEGAIVMMSSVGGQVVMPGFGAYYATKFVVEAWPTRSPPRRTRSASGCWSSSPARSGPTCSARGAR
jgi:short-subunit dehydrogenase